MKIKSQLEKWNLCELINEKLVHAMIKVRLKYIFLKTYLIKKRKIIKFKGKI